MVENTNGVDQELVKKVCQEYSEPQTLVHSLIPLRAEIHNADILFRDNCTIDELIDVIEGNRKYMPCLYVVNKCDNIGLDEVDK